MISRILHGLTRPHCSVSRGFARNLQKASTPDELAAIAKTLPAFQFDRYADFMKRLDTVITEDSKK
jgi:hypothetical protein